MLMRSLVQAVAGRPDLQRMVLGYLVNTSPRPSHRCVRRKIAAVEALGHLGDSAVATREIA